MSEESPSGEKMNKNQMGYFACTSYVVGNIIGSGIFITPGTILTYTNSMGLSLIIWILCGITSIIGAIVYIELATAIPQPGCDFAYTVYVGWEAIAFSFMWVSTIMTYPASAAVQAITFGDYIVTGLSPVWKSDDWKDFTSMALGFVLLFLLTAINFFSISKVAGRFQVVATTAKVIIVFVIIITGFYYLIFRGWTQNLSHPLAGSVWAPGKLALAFYGGLWSYAGWDILNYGTPEIYKPRRTMPLSLLSGIVLVSSIYVLINFSYFIVLTPDQIKNSPAVAADFAQATLGNFSYSIPFLIAVLLVGTLNSNIFVGSRYMQAASHSGHLPKFLSVVNKKSGSPRASLIGQLICTIIVCFIDMNTLINYVTFVIWGQRTVVITALLYIRYKKIPVAEGVIRVPLVLILIFWVISFALVVLPFIDQPIVTLIGVAFVFSGLLFYFLLVWPKKLPNFIIAINEFLTRVTCKVLFCEVVKDEKLEGSKKNDSFYADGSTEGSFVSTRKSHLSDDEEEVSKM